MRRNQKTKSKSPTERELAYNVIKRAPRKSCWVVVARIGEIINHDERIIYYDGVKTENCALLHDASKLDYVYFADMTDNTLISLVADTDNKHYIIRNIKSRKKQEYKGEMVEYDHIESTITIADSLTNILTKFTGTERNKYHLYTRNLKFKTVDLSKMGGVLPIDFIATSPETKKQLWCKLINQIVSHGGDKLDLSGYQLIDPELITDALPTPCNEIKTIIMYQNNKLHKFDWIKQFPQVSSISIWYSNMLKDKNLAQLTTCCPLLSSLQLHYCYQITGKCFYYIYKLPLLCELIVNNPVTQCQNNTITTVLSEREWKEIEGSMLTTILINSDNLTVDFTAYLVEQFKQLKTLVVSDHVLTKLHSDTSDGYDDNQITFVSFQNRERGFKRYRDIRFKNLLRNNYESSPFSDSMLNVIKHKHPDIHKHYQKMNNDKYN